ARVAPGRGRQIKRFQWPRSREPCYHSRRPGATAMRQRFVLFLTLTIAATGVGAVRWFRAPWTAPSQFFASLDRRVARIDFRSIPARHAFAELQAVSGVRIESNWDSME